MRKSNYKAVFSTFSPSNSISTGYRTADDVKSEVNVNFDVKPGNYAAGEREKNERIRKLADTHL